MKCSKMSLSATKPRARKSIMMGISWSKRSLSRSRRQIGDYDPASLKETTMIQPIRVNLQDLQSTMCDD